jgi:uracil-DNA glycosylase family 4
MGFFFTKSRPGKRTGAGAGRAVSAGMPPSRAKQTATTLARLGCSGCPLNNAPVITPKMTPTLVKGGQIYFLAEAPGRDEDERTGKPLTGPSGQLLRECIPDDWEGECSFDNVINCRPPKNRDPAWQEIECCRPRRVKYIEQAKPRLIIGLGAVPLQAVLGSQDLKGMRGRIFAVKFGSHSCWFLPTYHPSFILRVAKNKAKPLNSLMGHCFRMDIRKAFELVEGLEPPHIDDEKEIRSNIQCFDGSKSSHIQSVIDLLYEARKAPIKAVDIETKGLRPYKASAAIMTAAISFKNTNFSFALDHPKAVWPDHVKPKLRVLLKSLLKDDTIKVAHNAPFEIEWFIWYLGRDIINHGAWHCTQMQAHFLDERRGKSRSNEESDRRAAYQALDFLCKQHFGFTYKSLFKLDKKDMSKSPLGETLLYNGVDTKITLRLHHRQVKLLKQFGLYDAYIEALPRQSSVAMMQFLGVPVDQAEVKKAQKKLGPEIKQIEADIAGLKVVKAYERDHGKFEPSKNEQIITVYKDYLKRTEIEVQPERYEAHDFNKSSESKRRFDDKGGTKYSVDKNVLEQIDHPLSQLVIDFRNRSKLLSTYVDELELGKGSLIYPDGLLHPNFNTTFTETGRTCVAGNTILDTTKGSFEIKNLDLTTKHKNAHIKTHAGKTCRIEKLWYKGKEPMYQLQFANGSHITCTARHRLLTPTGWLFANDIRVGQKVSTSNSFKNGHFQPRAIKSIWRAPPKYKNSLRERLCVGDAVALLPLGIIRKTYRDNIQDPELFPLLASSQISSSAQVCHQQKLRCNRIWEYTRSQKTQRKIECSFASESFNERDGVRSNCSRNEYFCLYDKTKYSVLRSQWRFSVTSPVWPNGRTGIINHGRTSTGASRSYKSTTLLQRHSASFIYALQSLSKWSSFDRKNQAPGAQYCMATKCTSTGGLLVQELRRSENSQISVGRKYKTPSSVAIHNSRWPTSGRFLSAKIRSSCRNRWTATCLAIKQTKGQGTSANLGLYEDTYFQDVRFASLTQLESSNGNNFGTTALTSIKYVGVQDVWDITVERDHSYVAQGLIHHNSSDDPNAQNWPQRNDAWVRNQIAAPDGYTLVAFDYGQLEACTVAMCSKDKVLVKALWEDYDIHYEWAERTAYEYPPIIGGTKFIKDKDVMKKFRSRIKNKLVFPAIFGAQNSSIAAYLDIPEEHVDVLMREFWKTFHGLYEWQERLMKQYWEVGWVETLNGRRRHYPMTRNQAINDPVQGTACEIVCDSMNVLSETAARTSQWHLHPILNIHDDLTMCIPDDDKILEKAIKDVYTVMLSPPYNFINVPLSVTCSVGKHWYKMTEIDKYWSHRDV